VNRKLVTVLKPLSVLIAGLFIVVFFALADGAIPYYNDSYALIIGIDQYRSSSWDTLHYAVKDAKGIAALLRKQGFQVITLYNEEATRSHIIREQNTLAKKLKSNDRVLIFFSGHGYTETIGEQDFGYVVPYDGTDTENYISMDELRAQSKKLSVAKHQLFLMDSCYGGLLGVKSGAIESTIPNYLQEITSRPARQVLMAGGKNQQVVDNGPGGHSPFTWYLLEAIEQGKGDLNKDGYITFPELQSYILPAATNEYQTPSAAHLPGHKLGEFVFESPIKVNQPPEPKPPKPPAKGSSSQTTKGSSPQTTENTQPSSVQLRSTPRENLSLDEVEKMLKERDFFDSGKNEQGKGIDHQYEVLEREGEKLVIDYTTGLTWQQSVSPDFMVYAYALKWIEDLNKNKFAGYDDWRLPTLEEAMSLMEPERKNGDLYIDGVFDRTQSWIWTADKKDGSVAWVVDFSYGNCNYDHVDLSYAGRAVR